MRIAQPLHTLTKKQVVFHWSDDCKETFFTLKLKLGEAPVLMYHNFDSAFFPETDASIEGLGAILSQEDQQGKLHPATFASRSLSLQEKNYAITELETLAVVWGVSHFCSYIYGQSITVFTDHSAVKAILETPKPTGKHAR